MLIDSLQQLSLDHPLIQASFGQKTLGKGGFGQVYPIPGHENPRLVLKYFDDSKSNQKRDESAGLAELRRKERNKERMKEVKILQNLRHRAVVQFVGCVVNGEDIVGIIMHHVKSKTLTEYIFEPEWSYSMFTVVCWMVQSFSVLVYLQQKGLLHLDIWPDNILVDHVFNLVFIDFGAARENYGEMTPIEGSYVGYQRYRSPEVKFSTESDPPKVSPASDIYSMGLVCWEMIERRRLFEKYGVFDNEEFKHEFWTKKDLSQMEELTCYSYLKEFIFSCVRFEAEERTQALHALADMTLHKKILYEKLKEKLPFMPEKDERKKYIQRPQAPNFEENEHRVNQVNWYQEDLGLADFLDKLVISENADELKMQRKLIARESTAHLSQFAVLQFWLATNLYLPYYHIDFRELYPAKNLEKGKFQESAWKRKILKKVFGKGKFFRFLSSPFSFFLTSEPKVAWWDRLIVESPHQVAKTSEMMKCFVSPQICTRISESAQPEDFLAKCGLAMFKIFAPRLESMKLKFRGWFSERAGQDLPAKGYIFQIIFPPRSICNHRPRCVSHKIMHPLWKSPRLSVDCPLCCDRRFPEYVELYFELVDFFFKIRHLTELSQLVRAVAQMAYLRAFCSVISCPKVFLFKRVFKNSKSFLALTSLSSADDEIVLCLDEKLEMVPFNLKTATAVQTYELNLLEYLDGKLVQKICKKFVANYRNDCPLLKELAINKRQLKKHFNLLNKVCRTFFEVKGNEESLEKQLERLSEARASFSIDLFTELFQKLREIKTESKVQSVNFLKVLKLEDSIECQIGKAVFERGFEVNITDFPNLLSIIERPLSLLKAKGDLEDEKQRSRISSLISRRNAFICIIFAIGAMWLSQFYSFNFILFSFKR